MTTYLVVKRMVEDRVYLPNEVVVDPDNAEILMARGYLMIVPSDFTGPGGKKDLRRPTVEESMAAGYSEAAAQALADGSYDDDPEIKKMVDAETEAIDQNLSKDPDDTHPTESQLKAIVAGMQEVDLNAAIQTYEISVPAKGDEPTREENEAAMVAWLLEHPEITEDDGDPIVPSDTERLGLNTDTESVGAGGGGGEEPAKSSTKKPASKK